MRFWQQKNTLSTLLQPAACLYKTGINFRRFLYKNQLKKQQHFPVPIIVVGNLSVGGSGKTPLVIWLSTWLQQQGLQAAIVSRGYKAKPAQYPYLVTPDSHATDAGDEALLLARQTHCPVMIDPNRPRAVRALLQQYGKQINVIISDDGLQHYALGRDIEIAMVDGQRRYGNGYCLPAGPLREPLSRLTSVDFVISKGQAAEGEYAMQLVPEAFHAVHDRQQTRPVDYFAGKTVHAVAGIGNPDSFFQTLTRLGLQIIEHPFPDHYAYQENDLAFDDDKPIIMTAKDAVKCAQWQQQPHCYYLAVKALLPQQFITQLQNKLACIRQ